MCQFRCDIPTEATAWVEALAKRKKEIAEGPSEEEIVESIPLHEIASVGRMFPTFFECHGEGSTHNYHSKSNQSVISSLPKGRTNLGAAVMNTGFAEEAALNLQLDHDEHAFYVRTQIDGFNDGHTFCFKLPSDAENTSWIQDVSDRSDAARREYKFRSLSFSPHTILFIYKFRSPLYLSPSLSSSLSLSTHTLPQPLSLSISTLSLPLLSKQPPFPNPSV